LVRIGTVGEGKLLIVSKAPFSRTGMKTGRKRGGGLNEERGKKGNAFVLFKRGKKKGVSYKKGTAASTAPAI